MLSSGQIQLLVFAAVGAVVVLMWPIQILWVYLKERNTEKAKFSIIMYTCCVIAPTVCFVLLEILFDKTNWVQLPTKEDKPEKVDWLVVFAYAVLCTTVFDGICFWVYAESSDYYST
jgi:hypothetical protein